MPKPVLKNLILLLFSLVIAISFVPTVSVVVSPQAEAASVKKQTKQIKKKTAVKKATKKATKSKKSSKGGVSSISQKKSKKAVHSNQKKVTKSVETTGVSLKTKSKLEALKSSKHFNSASFGHHFNTVIAKAKSYKGEKIIIGKWAPGTVKNTRQYGYDKAAQQAGVKYFHVPAKVFNSWSKSKQKKENFAFLDKAAKRNARIYLATPRAQAKLPGAFKNEIDYLQKKHNYKFSKDGAYMYKN